MLTTKLIKNIPLFSSLSDEQIEIVKEASEEVEFEKDEFVMYQEDVSNDLYIVIDGEVSVMLSNEDGREIVVDQLKSGEIFGELSLFDDQTRSASVKALTDIKLILFTKEKFMKILENNPTIAVLIFSQMAKRLRRADEMLATLAFTDVCGRVAKMLIDWAGKKGLQLENGYIKIDAPTHKTIADQVGASREAVTKAMKSLSAQGFFIIENRKIIISPNQFEIF